jgi:hypothetical protein
VPRQSVGIHEYGFERGDGIAGAGQDGKSRAVKIAPVNDPGSVYPRQLGQDACVVPQRMDHQEPGLIGDDQRGLLVLDDKHYLGHQRKPSKLVCRSRKMVQSMQASAIGWIGEDDVDEVRAWPQLRSRTDPAADAHRPASRRARSRRIATNIFTMVWAAWVAYGVAVIAACGGLTRALMGSLLKARLRCRGPVAAP